MDANAKTGPCCEPIVFANDDSCSANIVFMIEFLKNFGLCLPSTTALHRGSHGTWTAPDGWTQHRIDYIALPQNELCFCMQSCSIDNFDTGNGHEDHQAVGVQLQWVQDRQTRSSKAKTGKHDRNAIKDQEHVIDLAAVQTCAWHEDIETQVQSLNQAIHCTLQAACPRQKQGQEEAVICQLKYGTTGSPNSICEDACRMPDAKPAWTPSDSSSGHGKIRRLTLMVLTWLLTLMQLTQTRSCAPFSNWTAGIIALHACWDVSYSKQKTRQLSHTLDQTSEVTPAGTLLQTLKPFIGPTNLKKTKKDRFACRSKAKWWDLHDSWRGPGQMDWIFQPPWRRYQNGSWYIPYNLETEPCKNFLWQIRFSIAIKELPSLAELEMAYRRVPFGKAVGNDGIPPEVCHVKARDLARLTYAILIKVFVYGQEAIEHKGGRLAVAWKHRGDVRDCDTHRSLLVSSHMGKTIHRALRQKTSRFVYGIHANPTAWGTSKKFLWGFRCIYPELSWDGKLDCNDPLHVSFWT